MKVLVHFDVSGENALGIWWVQGNGNPDSLYREPQSSEAFRGRMLVHNKSNEQVPWEVWFDRLADRPPYFEVWATYDSMGMSPQQLLTSLNPVEALI